MKELPIIQPRIADTEGFDVGDSLSFTRRKVLRECPRKFALRYGLGLEPLELAAPLRQGGAFAKCLEEADPRAHLPDYRVGAPSVKPDELDNWRKEAMLISILAEGYMERYGAEETRELYLEAPIGDTGKLNRGYVDFANHPNPSLLKLGEDKFRSRWTYEGLRMLEMDEQATGYFSLVRELGNSVNEMEYRVTIRPYLKKRDSVEQYVADLEKDVKKNPHKYFHTHTVERTDEQVALFRKRVEKDALNLLQLEVEGAFPQNPDSCFQYGKLCDYYDLCSRGSMDGLHVPERDDRSNKRDTPEETT